MIKHSRFAAFALAVCLLAGIAGCNTSKPLPAAPLGPRYENGYTIWNADESVKGEPVRGMDLGTIEWGLWNDDLVFAVWLDRDTPAKSTMGGNTGSFGRSAAL